MPKRKTVDAAKLIKMIEDETPQAEIMKKMGFKTSTQVKTAYMNALIAEGKAVAIKGGRGAGKAEKVKLIGVGKTGQHHNSEENWLRAWGLVLMKNLRLGRPRRG